jgi:hypothetical protein
MITVITSIMGGYDSVPAVPPGFEEAILVSDRPVVSDWTNIVMSSSLPSRLAAKAPKFRPDKFTDASSSVWIDATLEDDNGWLYEASRKALETSDFCLFSHPDRDNVSEEVEVSKNMKKYASYPLQEQLNTYKEQGFRDDIGLFACGVLARKHSPKNQEFGNAWLFENVRWSIQDQISFPYLVWQQSLEISLFNADLWRGPLTWKSHVGLD